MVIILIGCLYHVVNLGRLLPESARHLGIETPGLLTLPRLPTPVGDTPNINIGAKKAPKGSKPLQVGPEVHAAHLAREPRQGPQPDAADAPAREYLLSRYMHPLLRRTYERRAACIASCPLTSAAQQLGDVDRTCPACGAVLRDNATLRYRH